MPGSARYPSVNALFINLTNYQESMLGMGSIISQL